MASLPPEPILPAAAAAPLGTASDAALAERWDALHGHAARIALLARIAPEPTGAPFAAMIGPARDWQRTLVRQGLEDIEAMLTAGLEALATLTARGQDTAAPALALWREFHAARAAVLAALQPAAAA